MPKRLQVPERQTRALARILRFSKKERKQLIDTLKATKPTLLGRKFISVWAQRANVSEDEAQEVLQLMASLYISLDVAGKSIETFVEEVCDAIKASKNPTLQVKNVKWTELKSFFAKILTLDNTLGVTAKATDIRMEYGNVFCTARILTDLRPVFGRDVEKGPAAAVVIHEAKITFHEDGSTDRAKDFFVALDLEDIQQLKKLLDRAILKEERIKAMAEKGGINVLET